MTDALAELIAAATDVARRAGPDREPRLREAIAALSANRPAMGLARVELMPGEVKAAIQRAAAKVLRGHAHRGYVIDDMAQRIAEHAADALDEDRMAQARTLRDSPELVARLLGNKPHQPLESTDPPVAEKTAAGGAVLCEAHQGWRLLPVEPTAVMLEAGCVNRKGLRPHQTYTPSEVAEIYADMIAVAPKADELPDALQACTASVGKLVASNGTTYAVCVSGPHGSITPNEYGEKWKAEYDVACWNQFFIGGPEPDILAFGPVGT